MPSITSIQPPGLDRFLDSFPVVTLGLHHRLISAAPPAQGHVYKL
jgi:hypothetical protein